MDVRWSSDDGTVMAVTSLVHGASALEQGRRDRDGSEGAWCTVKVRWSSDEGTVMVVTCSVHVVSALEQRRRDRDGREGARCTVDVRWSSDDEAVMVVKELGAFGKCAGAVMKGP